MTRPRRWQEGPPSSTWARPPRRRARPSPWVRHVLIWLILGTALFVGYGFLPPSAGASLCRGFSLIVCQLPS